MDTLRKTRQWFIRCILPQPPHKLPGALPYSNSEGGSLKLPGPAPHGQIDVSLVRDQLRRADIVKAARIYKQGMLYTLHLVLAVHQVYFSDACIV